MPEKITSEPFAAQAKKLEAEVARRKKAESKLHALEKKIDSIQSIVSEWIWEVDTTGKFIDSSISSKQVIGYTSTEILGKYFYDFFHPDEKTQLKKYALDKFKQEQPIRNFKNRNLHKDGHNVWFLTHGVPLYNSNKNFIGFRGAITDITEQVIAERASLECGEHLRSLKESASNYAIYRLFSDKTNPHLLKVVFVSPSIGDIMGIQEPMKFETWFENLHPDDVERVSRANRRAFKLMKFDEEYRTWHNKKGEWRWIHAVSIGCKDENGWNGFVNSLLIDITEQKQAIEALKAGDAELKAMTNHLRTMNATLKFLLKKTETDKLRMQKKILANVKNLTLPYVEKLKNGKLDAKQRAFAGLIEASLKELVSPFAENLSSDLICLTPTEIRIADLVKQGKKTKEIAELANVSAKTIGRHRENIRIKLGITNKKVDLRNYLLSLS